MKTSLSLIILVLILSITPIKAKTRIDNPYQDWYSVVDSKIIYKYTVDTSGNIFIAFVSFANPIDEPYKLSFYLSYMRDRVSDYYTIDIPAATKITSKIVRNVEICKNGDTYKYCSGKIDFCDSTGKIATTPFSSLSQLTNKYGNFDFPKLYSCNDEKIEYCTVLKNTQYEMDNITQKDELIGGGYWTGGVNSRMVNNTLYGYRLLKSVATIDECGNLYKYGMQDIKISVYPNTIPKGNERFISVVIGESSNEVSTNKKPPVIEYNDYPRPTYFIESGDNERISTISLSKIIKDISYDSSFNIILEILKNLKYEAELLDKNSGKIITAWKDADTENYHTRIVIEFSSNRSMIKLKSEAEFHLVETDVWIKGYDTKEIADFKKSIISYRE